MMAKARSSGYGMVEIVVAAAIIITVVTAAAGAWQIYLRTSSRSTATSQAALLAEETAEALHFLRDVGWTNKIAALSNGVKYQLYWDGVAYSATTSDVVIQGSFIRTFSLSAVNRDASYDIVPSGGSNDPDTRKVSVSVALVGATSTPLFGTEFLIHNVYDN